MMWRSRKGGVADSCFSLETQTWYEPYQTREYRLLMNTDLFRPLFMNVCNVCNVCLFLELINPVLLTSKQLMVHL